MSDHCLARREFPDAHQRVLQADELSADAAPLFRVFLTDGRVLVSFGEYARLDDRLVFSMPTSPSAVNPQLQLVNIPSNRVDWAKTTAYAETLRATRYRATRAETDYAELSGRVAQTLNAVGLTADAAQRLKLVENARKTLAEWPATHYNYRLDEIMEMLGVLDEAIAHLRSTSGADSFDLSLVAVGAAPTSNEPLLPLPTARDTVESTLAAADTTATPAERMSLLTLAVSTLDAERKNLPEEWATSTRTETMAVIAREQEVDRKYQSLATRLLPIAQTRAAAADVRGVQRVLTQIHDADAALGSVRPDAVASLVSAVEAQLDTARRLRLERDKWALRATAFRSYQAAMVTPLARLQRARQPLTDIKALAGSSPAALGLLLNAAKIVERELASIDPPSELRDAHNMLMSAAQLTENAARIRREAAINNNLPRAWDASSAAAGALMLTERARTDMQNALRAPQLQQP
ncbi:MAG: hypothetical protein U0Q11_17490 [Vicinamibacterales bacterium]